jgi:hypothetical protein
MVGNECGVLRHAYIVLPPIHRGCKISIRTINCYKLRHQPLSRVQSVTTLTAIQLLQNNLQSKRRNNQADVVRTGEISTSQMSYHFTRLLGTIYHKMVSHSPLWEPEISHSSPWKVALQYCTGVYAAFNKYMLIGSIMITVQGNNGSSIRDNIN